GRASNIRDAERAAELLVEAGIELRVVAREPIEPPSILSTFPYMAHDFKAAEGCELVLVLGGDGTFLRAADLARKVGAPVLGVNLGHVGLLAEGERASVDGSLQRVIERSYRVEGRMTIDRTVCDENGKIIGEDWALNEASVENLDRSGVLDAILEVDQRPVMAFGCDGVLVSTPTGSTSYAFSAGGPVLWPELDAILVVPNNAHALFT